MMNMEQYQTKDLGETAALIVEGLPMQTIHWKDGTAYFIFNDPDQCKKISQEYFFGSLKVPSRAYYDTLRMVKRKLFDKGGGYVLSKRRPLRQQVG